MASKRTGNCWITHAVFGAALCVVGADGIPDAPYVDTWTNNASGVVSWEGRGSYWASGTIPEITNSIPYSTNLTVFIDHQPKAPGDLQVIQGPWPKESGGNNIAWALNALVGGPMTAFEFYYANYCRPLLIRDPSRYQGVWQIRDAYQSSASSVMQLLSDATWTSTVNRVNLSGRMGFRVPSGTTAALEHPFGEGVFEVNRTYSDRPFVKTPTDGTLAILNSPGGESYLRVRNGVVSFHGRPGGDSPTLVPGAVLRLDASAAETFTTDVADGRTFVTDWRDADGRAISAKSVDSLGRPFLATDAATGKPIVDFGKYGNYQLIDDPVLGRTASLKLDVRLDGVRELFIVFRDKEGGTTHPQFVGYSLREADRMFLRTGNGELFRNNHVCQMPLRAGEIRVNDRAEPANAPDDYTRRLTVVSAGLNTNFTNAVAPVQWIAGAEENARNGGIQIAELVLYTNTLTTAQRRQNNAALMRKWLPAAEAVPWDYGAVWFEQKDPVLDVATGTVAVRELMLADGTQKIVKTGAGTLVLKRMTPNRSDIHIEVRAGNVCFVDDVEKTADPRPAADPFCWFDATAQASFEMDEAGTGIARWHDRRDGTNHYGQALALARPNTKSPLLADDAGAYLAHPTFDAAAADGRGMVDLGAFLSNTKNVSDTGDTSSLRLYKDGVKQEAGNSDMREGYLVYYKKVDDAQFIASDNYVVFQLTGYNGSKDLIAKELYCHTRTIGGYWRYDGKVVDPCACPNTAHEVHILSFRLAHKLGINAFASDRGSTQWQLGGLKLGEVIYYDRLLSDQERRDTEAYLFRKWKGTPPPQDGHAPCAASLWLAPQTDNPALDSVASETRYAGVEGVLDGILSYTGAGTTIFTNAATSRVRAIEMRGGGSLDVMMDFDICSNAWFHLDATRADTMDYFAANSNAVDVWRDVRAAGVSASAIIKGRGARARPFRCETDVNGTDWRMPVIDFGDWYNGNEPTNAAASMEWSARTALREFYLVQRDKGLHRPDAEGGTEITAIKGYPCLFGQLAQNTSGAGDYYVADSDQIAFFRNTKGLLTDWATPRVFYGYVGVNGEKKSGAFEPATNTFYVYSFQPTGAVHHVQTFARRDSYQVGGQQIGEMVCFAQTNTVERRTEIENYLMRKWFGPTVGAAATWRMDTVTFYDASELTVRVPAWQKLAVGAFAFVFDGTSVGHFTVDGTFVLPETGTWTVDVTADRERVAYGIYPLLTAANAEGLDNLDNWTKTFTRSGTANFAASLRKTATGVSLVISPAGTLLILR